jgi:novel protein kinase C epsilon type
LSIVDENVRIFLTDFIRKFISIMVIFNGKMFLKIIEADNLRATSHSTRYFPANPSSSFVSPYISIDIDDLPLGRTHTKERTTTPTYNEEYSSEVHNGHQLHFTIFHDAALPPDEYVADCTIKFENIHDKKSDIWIDLEPAGRIHISIELQGQFSDCKFRKKTLRSFRKLFFSLILLFSC